MKRFIVTSIILLIGFQQVIKGQNTHNYQEYLTITNQYLAKFKYDSALYFLEQANGSAQKFSAIQLLELKVKRLEILQSAERFSHITPLISDALNFAAQNNIDNPSLLGSIWLCKARHFASMYDYRQSGNAIETAIEFFEKISAKPNYLLAKARIFQGMQAILNYDFEPGFNFVRQGLQEIAEVNVDNAEIYLQGKTAVGRYYVGLDLDSAHYHYKEGIIKTKKFLNPKNKYLATIYNNLASVYKNLGEYEQSEICYLNSLDIKSVHYPEAHPAMSAIYNNLGLLYHNSGQNEKAQQYLQKAVEIDRKINSSFSRDLAIDLNNLGLSYNRVGKYEAALKVFDESLTIRKKIYGEIDRRYTACMNNIILVYQNLGRYDDALKMQYKMKEIFDKIDADSRSFDYLFQKSLAITYYLSGNVEGALEHTAKFFHALFPNQNTQDIFQLPELGDIPWSSNIHMDLLLKSKILFDKYEQTHEITYLDTGLKSVSLAIDYGNESIHHLANQSSKQDLFEEIYKCYEYAIFLSNQLFKTSQDPTYLATAFNFMEGSKSFLLLENLNTRQVKYNSNIPKNLLALGDSLTSNIALVKNEIYEEKQLANNADQDNIQILQAQQLELQMAYEGYKYEIKQSFPEYFRMIYENEVLNIQNLRSTLLSNDELILSYFLGEKNNYIMRLDQQNFDIIEMQAGDWLAEDIQNLRDLIADKQSDYATFKQISKQLYDSLLAPIVDISSFKKLIIIPDGIVNYLPFELLLSDDKGNNYRDLSYLIKTHQLTYQYSTRVWNQYARQKKQDKMLDLLAFAPDFNSNNNNVAEDQLFLAYNETVRGNLVPLSGTVRELNNIQKLIAGKTLQGLNASEGEFKKNAGKYGIIHLATHAIIDDMNPMHSRLLFTQIDEIDGEDGDLHSWELYNMHLNARLAVLSACNTGFGKLNRGEGVMSLGRAFAYAGCPSVIMSLWPAQDAVTADIMTDFYKNLVNSVPIDQSLRKAKLNYLENSNDIFSHPFYWAGFVAQGDTSPLWIEKNAIGWRWLVVFFPVFLFSIIYYFLLKNEKTTKV